MLIYFDVLIAAGYGKCGVRHFVRHGAPGVVSDLLSLEVCLVGLHVAPGYSALRTA